MRWGLSISLVLLSTLIVSPVVRGQGEGAPKPVNPFGGGGGGQPPAPPPVNPFATGDAAPQAAAPSPTGLSGAAADPTGGDPAKQKQLLDDMVAKKLVFKATVKGRTASLLVGNGFAELPDDQQINVARAAYKVWVIGEETKFKGPMTVFLSDGEKPGARFAMYFVTLKGDGLKLARPKRQQQQPGYDPAFFPPAAPVEPPGDPNDPFNQ